MTATSFYVRSKQNVQDNVRPLEDSAGNLISQGGPGKLSRSAPGGKISRLVDNSFKLTPLRSCCSIRFTIHCTQFYWSDQVYTISTYEVQSIKSM